MLVEPDDLESFTAGIERALTDGDWRAETRRTGLSVAGGYSWGRCVSETVDVYKMVLSRAGVRLPTGWIRKLRSEVFSGTRN